MEVDLFFRKKVSQVVIDAFWWSKCLMTLPLSLENSKSWYLLIHFGSGLSTWNWNLFFLFSAFSLTPPFFCFLLLSKLESSESYLLFLLVHDILLLRCYWSVVLHLWLSEMLWLCCTSYVSSTAIWMIITFLWTNWSVAILLGYVPIAFWMRTPTCNHPISS